MANLVNATLVFFLTFGFVAKASAMDESAVPVVVEVDRAATETAMVEAMTVGQKVTYLELISAFRGLLKKFQVNGTDAWPVNGPTAVQTSTSMMSLIEYTGLIRSMANDRTVYRYGEFIFVNERAKRLEVDRQVADLLTTENAFFENNPHPEMLSMNKDYSQRFFKDFIIEPLVAQVEIANGSASAAEAARTRAAELMYIFDSFVVIAKFKLTNNDAKEMMFGILKQSLSTLIADLSGTNVHHGRGGRRRIVHVQRLRQTVLDWAQKQFDAVNNVSPGRTINTDPRGCANDINVDVESMNR